MVGMETVYLNGKQIILVFSDDGTVQQVDPVSGVGTLDHTLTSGFYTLTCTSGFVLPLAVTPYSALVDATRQVMCVVAHENTREIFVFTMSLTAAKTNYMLHVWYPRSILPFSQR